MTRLRVRSDYTTGRVTDRANQIGTAGNAGGLEELILARAIRVAEGARNIARDAAGGARSLHESKMVHEFADSIAVVDGGKDFRRRAYPSASTIRVALVTTENLDSTAPPALVEFGGGSIPGVFALTKATLDEGGRTL